MSTPETDAAVASIKANLADALKALAVIEGALAEPVPAPGPAISGMLAWYSVAAGMDPSPALKSPLIGGASIFARPDNFGTPAALDMSAFTKQVLRVNEAAKPLALMLICGTYESGASKWLDGIHPSELITHGSDKYAAFYSDTFTTRRRMLLQRMVSVAIESGVKPAMVRATMSWGKMGEPWGLGSIAEQYISKMAAAGYGTLTEAQVGEKFFQSWIDEVIWMDSWLPKKTAISLATGFAFGDNVGGLKDTNPSKHPGYLAMALKLRSLLPERTLVFQHNGAGPGDGASGYGLWLASSLGPNGKYPGFIGAQPVGGMVTDVVDPPRLSPVSKWIGMLDKCIEHGMSFCEGYLADVLAAVANTTSDGKAMNSAISSALPKWTK